MDDTPTPHDRLHLLLFGHREVVEDLLRHIVRQLDFSGDGKWVDELDWATLQRESEISIAEKLDKRIRDVVWSVAWRGSPFYLILLIEFQSQPDRHMVLRQLTYLSLFWQDLLKSGRVGPEDLLPPALPICLYNGEAPWRAPASLSELIAVCPKEILGFQPQFRHLVISELKVKVDIAAAERNTAGTIFAAQQVDNRAQLLAVLDAIERWLPPEQYASLRLDILTLVRFTVPDRLLEKGDKLHLEEFTMSPKECLTRELEEYGDEREAQGEARGRAAGEARGRADGEARGRADGQRSVLSKQLRFKFGPLPAHAEARLAQADSQQLEAWADRVLTASSLGEVWSD